MTKKALVLLCILLVFFCFGQKKDSIFIKAIVKDDFQIQVNQKIVYHNSTSIPQNRIKLFNWISAYRNTGTPLAERKLEDRKTDLYFAKKADLGNIQDLKISVDEKLISNISSTEENIYLSLDNPLNTGKSQEISLQYVLNLPHRKFTGYGKEGEEVALKYFFLVPDSFEDEKLSPKNYLDIEESQNVNTYWNIQFDLPKDYKVQSNLNQKGENVFEGFAHSDAEFIITKKPMTTFHTVIDNKLIETVFQHPITPEEKEGLEFYLPLHFQFIKEKVGWLTEKIFITEKFKRKEDFLGIQDIKFWKFKFQLFTDSEKTDLDYFSVISKNIVDQAITVNKNKNHWLENGTKTYLELQYLKKNYSKHRLLGDLPDKVSILGWKPFAKFNTSQLRLTDRYSMAYQYIMTQNLDQKISEKLEDLSNFNEMAVSKFQTGILFNFIGERMGQAEFQSFLRNFITQNREKLVDEDDFLNELMLKSENEKENFKYYIGHKNRIDFKLKSVKKNNGLYEIKVKKNTDLEIPFLLETQSANKEKKSFWLDTKGNQKEFTYQIPNDDAEKLIINDNYLFPESNYRNNYLYTKGFFSNTKKIKLKLFTDVPNPEYNEIFVVPSLKFNAYDKVMLGLNFSNKSLLDRKYNYSFTPLFSTGTGSVTGSASLFYTLFPAESFYRSWSFGVAGSYYHYNFNLPYKKLTLLTSMNFAKNPRSQISRNLSLSYNFYEKTLTPEMMLKNEYSKYNLWQLGYSFSDTKSIHEKYYNMGFQAMEDFQKMSAETYYRWEYAQNKKLSIRLFGGIFLNNKTPNNFFDYGVSKVSTYSFSYGLLGQSATSGIFAQQYVLAEGGFKSLFNLTANQWITSMNTDFHLWKWFNLYADAGLVKNKNHAPRFLWDSGVKLKVIPDFLEIYFPVQSSLGFEPSFKDYGTRIRFTLNFNLGAAINYFRRGWY